jgi:hypothetical protein
MAKKISFLLYYRPLVLSLIFILIAACAKDEFAGSYRAEEKDSSGRVVETIIELKPNGEGAWKSDSEEISFAWYIKGGELRINTKEGGVIVGGLEKDTIQMTLPGKKMTFRKIR